MSVAALTVAFVSYFHKKNKNLSNVIPSPIPDVTSSISVTPSNVPDPIPTPVPNVNYTLDVYGAIQTGGVSNQSVDVVYKIGLDGTWTNLVSHVYINVCPSLVYIGQIIAPKGSVICLGVQSLGINVSFSSSGSIGDTCTISDFNNCGSSFPQLNIMNKDKSVYLIAQYTDGFISC